MKLTDKQLAKYFQNKWQLCALNWLIKNCWSSLLLVAWFFRGTKAFGGAAADYFPPNHFDCLRHFFSRSSLCVDVVRLSLSFMIFLLFVLVKGN